MRRKTGERAKFLLLLALAFRACVKYKILLLFRPFAEIIGDAPPVRESRMAPPVSDISKAIRISARLVPGANCLPQALAMRELMHRYGRSCELQLGVATKGQFRAHAWVTCAGEIVHGWTVDQFTTLEMAGNRSIAGDRKG